MQSIDGKAWSKDGLQFGSKPPIIGTSCLTFSLLVFGIFTIPLSLSFESGHIIHDNRLKTSLFISHLISIISCGVGGHGESFVVDLTELWTMLPTFFNSKEEGRPDTIFSALNKLSFSFETTNSDLLLQLDCLKISESPKVSSNFFFTSTLLEEPDNSFSVRISS